MLAEGAAGGRGTVQESARCGVCELSVYFMLLDLDMDGMGV